MDQTRRPVHGPEGVSNRAELFARPNKTVRPVPLLHAERSDGVNSVRILAVTPYYHPEGGGLERYADGILRRLAARFHEVEAITMTRTGLASGPHNGVHVERVPSRFALGNAPIDPSFGAAVRQRIRQFRPDAVLAHTPVPFAAELASRAARQEGVPFALTYHAGRLSGSSRALGMMAALHRRTFEARMLARCPALIAVSPYVRDHALRSHRDRVSVIPPGVDHRKFRSDGPAQGQGILFVGPLSRSYVWKGVDVLLDAFQQIRTHTPNASLTFVGDGDRRAELTARARAIGGDVRFTGRLSEEALVAEYDRAAVVVLPSTSQAESFGMVLAEANACGRPVVASNIGGIPDFVSPGENGLLAQPGDSADLAVQISTVLDDQRLAAAMGASGRRRVMAEHDWHVLAMRTQAVLEDITRSGR